MATENRVLEVQGEDVDQAITAGLTELGLERADVSIEILDEGSSGFLGIGGRDASVRLTVREIVTVDRTAPVEPDPVEPVAEEEQSIEESERLPETDGPNEREVAAEIVNSLLDKMGLEATTTFYQTEPDDLTGEQRLVIDIQGEDLGVLIGQRGETLNALQFVSRLMAGHILHRRPTFIVDVENYRERRESALARLADRMASKAIKRGRPLSLEPMPPNERRIIHMTLRDHDQVYTESTGEGRRRKVQILLK